jgi:putative membrane protein
MKKLAFNFLLAASLFAAVACNENKKEDSAEMAEEQNEEKFGDRMEDDTEFAVAAASGGMMEVQMGELAQRNGSSAAVKEFGKMMVNDHGKANEELKALAQQKNITLPTSMGEDKQEMYDDLAKKTGKDFDKAYADMMVKDHKKDIDEFKEMAEDGKDPELKSWASGKVATLEMHLQKAEAMKDAVK